MSDKQGAGAELGSELQKSDWSSSSNAGPETTAASNSNWSTGGMAAPRYLFGNPYEGYVPQLPVRKDYFL